MGVLLKALIFFRYFCASKANCMNQLLNRDLTDYVEKNIIPQYESFDKAHQRDHAYQVIERSLNLAKHYDVDINMVYAVAAYHDTGLCEGRETHHTASKHIILTDKNLRKWFNEEQIATMADAAEDHRASSGHEPRSIYGKIVAEADRLIDPETVMRRTIQYGIDHYPQLDKEGQYQRFKQHLIEKYSDTGYIKLWLPESDNAPRLEELRKIIRSEDKLKECFEQLYC